LPSEINLQASLNQAAQYLPQINNIGVSDDTHDLYYLVDFLNYLVDQAYPKIPCKSGCSNCCVESGLPRTSSLEWQHIYTYLKDMMPPDVFETVLAQNERLHRDQISLFQAEQSRIETPEKNMPLPEFGCKQCPLLVNNMCTIYPVRPAICRGFGYFTWRPPGDQDSQIFACQMAADTLLDSLREQNIETAALPVWNSISNKVYELEQRLGTGTMSTLPMWLFSHTQNGKLQENIDLKPNFGALK